MKKKVKQKKENGERWLLTYSDMITLLLALFIVLYAISNVDTAKYHSLAEALNQSMGDGNGTSIFDGKGGILDQNGNTIKENTNGSKNSTPTPAPTTAGGEGKGSINSQEDMKNLMGGINSILNNLNISDSAGTGISDRGLTITFSNDVFYDSGKADLKEDLKKGLEQISVLLNRVDNPIVVEGYSDNIPISGNSTFSSNWALSAVRAANVADYLVDVQHINGNRVSATGYGEYHPKASNLTAEGRMKNRRVELTVTYNNVNKTPAQTQ